MFEGRICSVRRAITTKFGTKSAPLPADKDFLSNYQKIPAIVRLEKALRDIKDITLHQDYIVSDDGRMVQYIMRSNLTAAKIHELLSFPDKLSAMRKSAYPDTSPIFKEGDTILITSIEDRFIMQDFPKEKEAKAFLSL